MKKYVAIFAKPKNVDSFVIFDIDERFIEKLFKDDDSLNNSRHEKRCLSIGIDPTGQHFNEYRQLLKKAFFDNVCIVEEDSFLSIFDDISEKDKGEILWVHEGKNLIVKKIGDETSLMLSSSDQSFQVLNASSYRIHQEFEKDMKASYFEEKCKEETAPEERGVLMFFN